MKTVLRFAIMLTITAALCLCLGANAFAEDVAVNETNFPDTVFREYVTRYDLDTNGILSDAERADVGYMFINSQGISSLQGIEFFTVLRGKSTDQSGSQPQHGPDQSVLQQ